MEARDGPTLLRLVKAAICHLYVLVVAGQSLEVSGTITGPAIYVAPLESGRPSIQRRTFPQPPPRPPQPITLHLPAPDVAPVHARSRTHNGPASYTHPRAPAVPGVSRTRQHAARAANPRRRWSGGVRGGAGGEVSDR